MDELNEYLAAASEIQRSKILNFFFSFIDSNVHFDLSRYRSTVFRYIQE